MHGKIIPRQRLINKIKLSLKEAPITVLLGARQTGKTTLARMLAAEYKDKKETEIHFFDLERAASKAALSTPEITLESLNGLVIIDEIQRMPELFEILRPLSDRPDIPARFLVLGSASPGLVKGVSESLAGRALFVKINGIAIDERGFENQDSLWIRGGFPRSLLASSEEASIRWRDSFITSFLERDIPQLNIKIPSETLRRFWMMTAHYHGQIWNSSELARSIGASPKTALYYRDILAGGYVVRILSPWFENLKKRQIKSPKVYIRDTGLLHTLLGIRNMLSLRSNPVYGASWEGFAMEQILSVFSADNAYFWKTAQGAEIDLLIFKNNMRLGFEFKCSDAPSMTKSIHTALNDLFLDKIFVIYPGNDRYPLHEKVEAVPLKQIYNII